MKSQCARPNILALSVLAVWASFITAQAGPNDTAWIKLFNKADTSLRTNWDIKFTGYTLNNDPYNVFRRSILDGDTVIDVNYTGWTGAFNTTYGHLCYKSRTFSYYIIRAEYMARGEAQPSGVATWQLQNNGLMLHAQSAASMETSTEFPQSIEAQILGPDNTAAVTNTVGSMNVCTPNTHWYTSYKGTANMTHCVAASANTRPPVNTWGYAAAMVLGDSVGRLYAGTASNFMAQNVFTFWSPRVGETANTGAYLKEGYIHLQAEGAPYRFRRVEVADLVGCKTPGDVNYKSYLMKHDSTACGGVAGVRGASPREARIAAPMSFVGNAVKVGGNERVMLEVFDLSGALTAQHSQQAPYQWSPSVKTSGMHLIRATTPHGQYTEKVALF